ncbi:DUF4249 domain-containing protein [Jiulongibacter sediminis]|jgi:hypothetical protein|uniref:DUF4249 domain-containing protein n=1 Tax=Jiulongibacter sediminis TaxID=1605367 RepID=UPI0026F2ED68|nr:DUF4249 domain-containing protein [Jiulongibacter sediminis]
MKQHSGRLLLFFFFLTLFFSCVDTYDVRISGSKKYLIVEGTITNVSDERQRVKIFETDDQSEYVSTQFSKTIFSPDSEALPVQGAEVKILENGSTSWNLTETEPGIYDMPQTFFANLGRTYQLQIKMPDGRNYESSVEEMLPVADIENFEVRLNLEGIQTPRLYNIRIPTQDFYLDFKDPAGEQNFYSWSWTDYEIQKICHTCKQGRYYTEDGTASSEGDCVIDSNLHPNTLYEYECSGFCWEIFPGEDIQIFSDVFTDGQLQTKKPIAQVPALQKNTSLVVIQQKSLTPGAFRYLKLIEDQSVNSGSLADTPPAPIKSNVLNINKPEELVLGYFTASSVKELRHMLSRADVPGVLPDHLFAALNNRDPILEPESEVRTFIPLATCRASENRTPIAPRNWQFGQ